MLVALETVLILLVTATGVLSSDSEPPFLTDVELTSSHHWEEEGAKLFLIKKGTVADKSFVFLPQGKLLLASQCKQCLHWLAKVTSLHDYFTGVGDGTLPAEVVTFMRDSLAGLPLTTLQVLLRPLQLLYIPQCVYVNRLCVKRRARLNSAPCSLVTRL